MSLRDSTLPMPVHQKCDGYRVCVCGPAVLWSDPARPLRTPCSSPEEVAAVLVPVLQGHIADTDQLGASGGVLHSAPQCTAKQQCINNATALQLLTSVHESIQNLHTSVQQSQRKQERGQPCHLNNGLESPACLTLFLWARMDSQASTAKMPSFSRMWSPPVPNDSSPQTEHLPAQGKRRSKELRAAPALLPCDARHCMLTPPLPSSACMVCRNPNRNWIDCVWQPQHGLQQPTPCLSTQS